MKYFLITIASFLTINAFAQQKISFSSQNYVGMMVGEQGSKLQLQTINGIKYNTWFAGIGTGLDWYYQRSIPAFLSINKDIFQKRNKRFFGSADGGINFPWKDDKTTEFGYYQVEKLLPGLYWGAGVGYKIGIGKGTDAILFQVGYNYKYSGEKVKPVYYYPDITFPLPYPQQQYDERYDYHLHRLSLKIGWSF